MKTNKDQIDQTIHGVKYLMSIILKYFANDDLLDLVRCFKCDKN